MAKELAKCQGLTICNLWHRLGNVSSYNKCLFKRSLIFFWVKFQRSIEELLVSPMPTYLILIGFVLGGVVRGIIVGFLVLLTSLIFTDITVQNVPLTLLVVVMTAFLFSIAGFLNALFADNFDDINIVLHSSLLL